MKKVVCIILAIVGLALLSALGATALAAPGKISTKTCSSWRAAHMSVPALHWYNKPIRENPGDLSIGPIWDPYYWARPGDGKTMVVDGHDVTPVPGGFSHDWRGAHGPFFNMHKMKRHERVIIVWKCVVYLYRTDIDPTAWRQCLSKSLNEDPARLADKKSCRPFNKPINRYHRKVETIFMRCCWPQYTRHQFLYERAVLVRSWPVRG